MVQASGHLCPADPDPRVAALTAELKESLEQQAATAEVLRTISSSPSSAQPVFDMIARCAKQLCDGEFCAVFRFEGELIHLVAHHGISAEGAIAGVPPEHFLLRTVSRIVLGLAQSSHFTLAPKSAERPVPPCSPCLRW